MSHGPSLTVLRTYAQRRSPEKLPPSLLFSHTPTTLTLFDLFPKALFHFLVLPRASISPALSIFDLAGLRTLLRKDRELARGVLYTLRDEAARVRASVRGEMRARYGFEWDVWTGFHAVPSMEHLHLHVISSDLVSPSLKTKKHYNSFHPELGFFLQLDTVLEWLDAEPSYYDTMSRLKISEYEPLLKDPLNCFRCGKTVRNMPELKVHLKEEWDALRKRGVAAAVKRKREPEDCDATEDPEPQAKRSAVEDPDAMELSGP